MLWRFIRGGSDMPNYNYDEDIVVARKTEQEVADLVCRRCRLIFVSFCHNADYDFLLENTFGKRFSYEVKEDFSHEKTGNIGVEFNSRGHPSGISVSLADFYVYKLHNGDGSISVWIIKTETLKNMIKNCLYHKIVCGGDRGSNSMNYLFRDEIFYKNAVKIYGK
jgi:hypothetical protein